MAVVWLVVPARSPGSPWPTFEVLASRPIALEPLGARPREQYVLF